MKALVSVLAWAGIALSTLFWTSLIALVWLFHRWADPQKRLLHRLCSCWGRALMAMAPGCRVSLRGLEKIPTDGPVIFMANHQSYVDVPALFAVSWKFRWMADTGLFKIPVFGWAMAMAGYIPVDRGNARAAIRSLVTAKDLLARGTSVFLFPEGTRSHTGVFGRFQMGGFRLAAQSGVPVVPVVVTGTRMLLPRGTWIFNWGVPVEIRFLDPEVFPSDLRQARLRVRPFRARMWAAFAKGLRASIEPDKK